MLDYFQTASRLSQEAIPFICVTLISHRGHAPQDNGAKALVTKDGLHWGTVGGGKVEAKAIDHAIDILNNNKTQCKRCVWNLQNDVGMTCGGEVELLFESFNLSQWNVYLFGAGHVAQSLSRLLLTLNLKLNCFDHRQEWLDKLPKDNQKLSATKYSLKDNLEQIVPQDPSGYYVIMTQGHSSDLPVLEAVLKKFTPAYIGVIGSPVKATKIRAALIERNISSEAVENLCCPMGLDLGSNDPAEIAISIAAQLISFRDNP